MRCEQLAAVTVAMRYEAREVLLTDLAVERDPNLLDLCGPHANGLTPPLGWRIRDQRSRWEAPELTAPPAGTNPPL